MSPDTPDSGVGGGDTSLLGIGGWAAVLNATIEMILRGCRPQ